MWAGPPPPCVCGGRVPHSSLSGLLKGAMSSSTRSNKSDISCTHRQTDRQIAVCQSVSVYVCVVSVAINYQLAELHCVLKAACTHTDIHPYIHPSIQQPSTPYTLHPSLPPSLPSSRCWPGRSPTTPHVGLSATTSTLFPCLLAFRSLTYSRNSPNSRSSSSARRPLALTLPLPPPPSLLMGLRWVKTNISFSRIGDPSLNENHRLRFIHTYTSAAAWICWWSCWRSDRSVSSVSVCGAVAVGLRMSASSRRPSQIDASALRKDASSHEAN